MKRLKGPELKLSELKVPPALRDLYLDLRDRRLLPLIALIVVAIAATPVLLGGGGEMPAPAVPPSAGGPAEEASLAVLPAEPGLREPSKRLAGLPPKDPFRPHYTAPMLNPGSAPVGEPSPSRGSSSVPVEGGSEGGSGGGESSTPAPEPQPVPVEPSGGSGSGGASPAGGSGGHSTESEAPHGAILYTLAVTLQITRIETKADGSLDKKGPTLYKEVLAPTPLPGEKTPVITYLGMGAKHHEPLFLVSNEVSAVFGEANCISGAGTCQLLTLEEGFPVTFVYGDNHVRYKVDLVKVKPVLNGHS